jgi:hypothetical protein
MNLNFIGRVCRIAAIGAILFSSASCLDINERLGENLIPTDQLWDVFIESAPLEDVVLKTADSLSAYSNKRFTFGSIYNEELGLTTKSTSFTLVPVVSDIDFGENTVVRQFRFNAVRDTLSTMNDNEQRMLQNVYVYSLKKQLDSTVLYTNAFNPGVFYENETVDNRERFIDFTKYITAGIPVYGGGDSLAFDFSKAYANQVIEGIRKFRKETTEDEQDSLKYYLNYVPGIYIESDKPAGTGGRINMFDLPLEFDDFGYMSGNYAELKITADYEDRKQVDTSFIFIFGPSSFIAEDASTSEIPTQYAFNASEHATTSLYDEAVKAGEEGLSAAEKIIVEGGSGLKPVILAKEIKEKLHKMIDDAKITNSKEVVINKATITLPYNVNADWSKLDKYPVILSPTVRLRSSGDTKYVSYAGLTDSSIESENQGNINRSLSQYAPDISHHVQEILKLEKKADETAAEFEERLANYDIWMLIMSEEVTSSSSSSSASSDYYNNLLYNSYYNNMMYDPYGYGYGYGGYGGYYGGYGYGGYGGYGGYDYSSNYYNYMMMAMYANASTTTGSSDSVSIELDKDRYFDATLNGTQSSADIKALPRLSVTFAAPKTAEAK